MVGTLPPSLVELRRTSRFANPASWSELPHPPLQHAIVSRDDGADRAHRRTVHVQQMRKRCRVAGRNAGERSRVALGAHHHHAVLDLALAFVDHGKALDLALAARLGDEVRHLAAVGGGVRPDARYLWARAGLLR